MKVFVAVVITVSVAACFGITSCVKQVNAKHEAKQLRNEQILRDELPSNCKVLRLEDYGAIDEMVVVTCDGRQTTSTGGINVKRQGKSTLYETFSSIEVK